MSGSWNCASLAFSARSDGLLPPILVRRLSCSGGKSSLCAQNSSMSFGLPRAASRTGSGCIAKPLPLIPWSPFLRFPWWVEMSFPRRALRLEETSHLLAVTGLESVTHPFPQKGATQGAKKGRARVFCSGRPRPGATLAGMRREAGPAPQQLVKWWAELESVEPYTMAPSHPSDGFAPLPGRIMQSPEPFKITNESFSAHLNDDADSFLEKNGICFFHRGYTGPDLNVLIKS